MLVGSWEEMRTDKGTLLIEWPGYWIMIIGPPVILLFVGLLLAWITDGLRDDTDETR